MSNFLPTNHIEITEDDLKTAGVNTFSEYIYQHAVEQGTPAMYPDASGGGLGLSDEGHKIFRESTARAIDRLWPGWREESQR